MSKDAKPTDDGLTQSERFMQAARELQTDDDPERFKERVRKIAKASLSHAKPEAASGPVNPARTQKS